MTQAMQENDTIQQYLNNNLNLNYGERIVPTLF